ncbi:G-protein coupled receptor 4-like [Anabas testudineus]|uniref:G-protein coupled receptor 4-like n=1 Tax=Anabas testudineus TaxID=64144 RepID=UPI000E45F6E6|nr:G-protein coupled receptor 4-like [Anabas testudineus]
MDQVIQLIISISLPLNGAAIYATCSQVPKDNTARIYFINLLICDFIQLYSLTALLMVQRYTPGGMFLFIYIFAVMVSVGFMVCITLDRYLVITRLRCSCIRQTIQISGVVCFVVWFVPLCIVIRVYPLIDFLGPDMSLIAIFLLLPYPLLVFLLCLTFRALCTASSVPPREKCRIVACVVLVLLIYSLLLLPTIIFLLGNDLRYHHFIYVFKILPVLSPLADTLLYFFLRKEAVDKPLNFLCCCKKERNDMSSSAVNDDDNMHAESSV